MGSEKSISIQLRSWTNLSEKSVPIFRGLSCFIPWADGLSHFDILENDCLDVKSWLQKKILCFSTWSLHSQWKDDWWQSHPKKMPQMIRTCQHVSSKTLHVGQQLASPPMSSHCDSAFPLNDLLKKPTLRGRLVEKRREIAYHYLRTWFFFDLGLITLDIVSVSTEWSAAGPFGGSKRAVRCISNLAIGHWTGLYMLLQFGHHAEMPSLTEYSQWGSGLGDLSTLRSLRVVRALRLLRLLKAQGQGHGCFTRGHFYRRALDLEWLFTDLSIQTSVVPSFSIAHLGHEHHQHNIGQ